jgi:hypothetical protein
MASQSALSVRSPWRKRGSSAGIHIFHGSDAGMPLELSLVMRI